MRIPSLSVVSTGSEEGTSVPFSFPVDLPAICMKCSHKLAACQDFCVDCYVEDEPDFDFIFRDDR